LETMKTMKLIIWTLVLGVMLSPWAYAQDDFTKNYKQDFSSGENTVLKVNNKFGDIAINKWDKNTVSIKVTVKVEDTNQKKANEVLSKIKINLSETGNVISAETVIDGEFNNTKFRIDYDISAPKNIKVDINNKFGHLYIEELATNGNIIEVKYGSLKLIKISGSDAEPRNVINLAYCKDSEIESANWIKLSQSYSKTSITKVKALIAKTKYSELKVSDCNALVAESKYDKYEFGNVNKFVCNGMYSSYKIQNLSDLLEVDVQYSGVEVEQVNKNFKKIDINNKYGGIELNIAPEASYKLKGVAEYCNIEYPKSENVNVMKKSTSLSISGTVGKAADAKAAVSIITKYGGVKIK
jgi:hypothetical protein